MYKYYNLQQRFGARIMFDDGSGAGSGGSGEGGQGTGQIDYAEILKDPKAIEAFQNTDFFKKAIQSEADKVRTKATGEKKTLEQEMTTLKDELAVLKNERLENIKTSVIEEIGIPLKYRGRIRGNTKEEMLEDAKALKADLDEMVNTTVAERLKGAGTDPGKEKKNDKMDAAMEAFKKQLKF